MSLAITSDVFAAGGQIPTKYSCQGQDISPPLSWSGVSDEAKSLALVVDDPDAPDPAAPKMIWVHWILYNLPPDSQGLDEDISPDSLPAGTLQGKNDWCRTGWGGPCPPVGRHRYFHKLYALDTVLPDLGEPDKAKLEKAIEGHVLAKAQIIGTYEKA